MKVENKVREETVLIFFLYVLSVAFSVWISDCVSLYSES